MDNDDWLDYEDPRWKRRDKMRSKKRHGMRVSGKSVFITQRAGNLRAVRRAGIKEQEEWDEKIASSNKEPKMGKRNLE